MDDRDKERFGVAIGAMFEAFGKEAGDGALIGYWFGLSDLTLEQAEQAIATAIRQCRFLPVPAELRDLATGGGASARALAAWNDVLKAVPIGAYKHVDFEDQLINASITSLGGWPTFLTRMTNADSEKWARHEFLKTYEALASSSVNGEACAPLAGLAEVQVVDGKLVEPLPVRIGCEPHRKTLPCPVYGKIENVKPKTIDGPRAIGESCKVEWKQDR